MGFQYSAVNWMLRWFNTPKEREGNTAAQTELLAKIITQLQSKIMRFIIAPLKKESPSYSRIQN
jgi:hypothetical protein